MKEIFKDLKIIELASVLAGPSVGMFFAELGAKVVKFENSLTQGDVTRKWKLPSESKEATSAYFSSINWGKDHIFVNYKKEEDLELVKELIADADIVICNFKKGGAEKFGLSYNDLKRTNPNLIYAQLNGFDSNPERVAFDVVLQAECGYMFMNGQQAGPPTKMPLALMDILAAHQLKEGILVALIKRLRDNKGSYVDCSLEKSALASLANQASNYLMANHIPQRIGSLHPNIAPYGEVFFTKDDKQIVLAIGSDAQFIKLCDLLNLDLHLKSEFTTNPARVKNRIQLETLLYPAIGSIDSEEFLIQCKQLQIPVGHIKNMQEVFENNIAQSMILEENIDNTKTKRISSVAFTIQ